MQQTKFRFYALILCAALIVIFAIQIFSSRFEDAFILTKDAWVQPWRFLTSIFLHGSLMHLLYNLIALAFFGSILEKMIGGKRFFLVFFVTGILANAIAVNFYSASLGASGAIFGVIGALIVIRPMLTVWAFSLPMPIFVAGIIWVIGDVIQTFVPSNIGTIAHLSGIFFGLIFGFVFRKKFSARYKESKTHVEEKSIRAWENSWMR